MVHFSYVVSAMEEALLPHLKSIEKLSLKKWRKINGEVIVHYFSKNIIPNHTKKKKNTHRINKR